MGKTLRYAINVQKKDKKYYMIISLFFFLATIFSLYLYAGKSLTEIGDIRGSFFIISPFFRVEATIFIYIIPLVSCITAVDIHFDEVNLYNMIFTKLDQEKLHVLRLVTVFLQTFLLLLIFLETILILMHVFLDTTNVNLIALSFMNYLAPTKEYPFMEIYLNNYVVFSQIYIMMISIYAALLSCVSYAISLFSSRKVFVYVFTFLVSLLIVAVFSLADNGWAVLYPQNLLLPFPLVATEPGGVTHEFGIVFWLVNLLIFPYVLIKLHKRLVQ